MKAVKGLIIVFFSSEPPTNILSYKTNHDKPSSVLYLTNVLSFSLRDRFDMELNYLKLNDENMHILRVPMPLYNFSKPPPSWVSFCCSVKQGQE